MTAVVLVLSDRKAAEEIDSSLPQGSAQVGERRSLDGSAAEWVVLANLVAPAIKPLLDSLLRYVELGRVESIKWGALEIKRPSKADVERIREHALAQAASDDASG